MRHIIPISGKDSLATALVQTTRQPDLPYEFLFNDVKAELPETYEWLDSVEKATGWKIERVGKSLPDIIEGYGGFLPAPNARYCTRESKIKPMENWIGKEEATLYYGLRADEVRTGYTPVDGRQITPVYPLREMMIDLQGVYSILDAQKLSPPTFFWKRLYDAVSERLASPMFADWKKVLSRTEATILFSGRTRGNCFFCFFQKKVEFVWLYETHPDYYLKARGMEKDEYSFIQGFPLASLDNEEVREALIEKKVVEVVTYITRKILRQGTALETDNAIALTSCGLLCGK